MLRIGVYTFTIQEVGQPTRYVAHIIFYTKTLIIHLSSVYLLGIMTRPVVNR